MQLSVRLTSEVERKLAGAVNLMHKPRNSIINDALKHYLDNLNVDAVEKDIAVKIQALNEADKIDDLTDFGDYL